MIIEAERLKSVSEYYFSSKLREIAQMNKDGKRTVINLAIGNPDLPPPKEVISTLTNASQKADAHGYQSYQGIPAFRDAFEKYYQNHYQVKLDLEYQILPLIGSKEGIMHISMAFLNKGDYVLIPEIGYPTYSSVTQLCQGLPHYYEMNEEDWMPNLEQLKKIPKNILKKTKIMWINYPNMPTGVYPNENKIEDLIKWTQQQDILLVNDNPYSKIGFEKSFSIFQKDNAKKNCLELNSLSKSVNMAGWRLGVVIGAKKYITSVIKVKSNMDSGMFKPLQEAGVVALNMPQEWYQSINAVYEERKKIAHKIANVLSAEVQNNSGGIFVWAKIKPNQYDSKALSEKILKEVRVFITPGFIFGKKGRKYIRISLCSSIETMKEALQDIEKIVW